MDAKQTMAAAGAVRARRVTGTVLGLMAVCVTAASALTLSQLIGLETEGGEWHAHALLIAVYKLGGKAAVAALFFTTGSLLAALCSKEFENLHADRGYRQHRP